MQRLSNGTQVASLPVPIAISGTPGFATAGNPETPLPASEWDADQYNRMQEEIIAPILATGLALDPNNNAQLLAAIKLLINQSFIGSLTNPGYMKIPIVGNPLILQWCRNLTSTVNSAGAGTVTFTFPVAFTTVVLGYSYVLTDEASAYNNWTGVADAPTLAAQTMNILTSAPAGSLCAFSGFVIGV